MLFRLRAPVSDEIVSFSADAAGEQSGAPGSTTEGAPLRLRLSRTASQVMVLSASGDLDLATTPRLSRLLWPRLWSASDAVIVDLSRVWFLGLAGVELLARAHAYADHRGIGFSVVTGTRAVDRALTAGGLRNGPPCFATLTAARRAAGIADGADHECPVPRNGRAPSAVTQP